MVVSLGRVRISQADWDELVAHARDETPNECCGYLVIRDGEVERVVRGRNERQSPYGYELDAQSMMDAWKLSEEDGVLVGSYHSHPKSAPEPSQTDINLAANWPDWLYVIVSLAGEPSVRAWWMKDGRVDEEPVEVA
jgi:[CysO sulfur-carrier protein]-S-L-cysteine hydrolase